MGFILFEVYGNFVSGTQIQRIWCDKKWKLGKINVLHVTTDPEKFKDYSISISYFYLTTDTETEFKGLLDEFLVENEFERNDFMSYVSERGYICIYLNDEAMNKF